MLLVRSKKNFTPPFDVIELEARIVVLVEVAGMQLQDFDITLSNHYLVIRGIRHRPTYEANTAYHRVEIGFGEFRLDIPIPWSVQRDNVSANYREGFLHVELPRLPEKQIRVVDSSGGQSS